MDKEKVREAIVKVADKIKDDPFKDVRDGADTLIRLGFDYIDGNLVEVLSVEEIVICAAIKFKCGKIIRGHRHGDCIMGSTYRDEKKPDTKGAIQGFITSRNRFVDRKEGMKIQKGAGIESAWEESGYRGDILFSEDLY